MTTRDTTTATLDVHRLLNDGTAVSAGLGGADGNAVTADGTGRVLISAEGAA